MRRKIILVAVLLVGLAGWASADVLTVPGFGHGFINTPVAWNSRSLYWQLSALGAFGGHRLANSGTGSVLYSYDRWEFGAGIVEFGDKNNTQLMGGEARYNFLKTRNDFYVTGLGGLQRSDSDIGGQSTSVLALLFGQKFRRGGVSLTGAYWTAAGQDSHGRDVGNDFEWAGNAYFDIDKKDRWKIFGEAYAFNDADKSGQAGGFIYTLQPNVKLSAAVLNTSNPFSRRQFELGIHMILPKPFNFDP